MERSVRYIQVNGCGLKPALGFRGRKFAHCVINDETLVRAIEVPVKEYDCARQVPHKLGGSYPPHLFATSMRVVGERKGITQRATALLDLIHTSDESEETELPPDEPQAAMPPTDAAESSSGEQSPQAKRHSGSNRSGKAADRSNGHAASAPKATAETAGSRGTLIAKLAVELKCSPRDLRVRLRKAGLRAPYADEGAVRKALK